MDKHEIKKLVNCKELAVFLGIKQGRGETFHCFNKGAHKHEDAHPSLSIKPEFFKCFGCGVSGDAIELVKQVKNISFPEAVQFLSDYLGNVSVKEKEDVYHPLKLVSPDLVKRFRNFFLEHQRYSSDFENWLFSRGLDPEYVYDAGIFDVSLHIEDFYLFLNTLNLKEKIGSGIFRKEESWLKTWNPIYKIKKTKQNLGALFWITNPPTIKTGIQFKFRYYKPTKLKSLSSFGTGAPLYPFGFNNVSNQDFKGKILFVVEGEMDFLTMYQEAKIFNSKNNFPQIAVIGLQGLNAPWLDSYSTSILDVSHIIVSIHRDKAGIEPQFFKKFAFSMHKMGFNPENLYRKLVDGKEDLNDKLKQGILTDWLYKTLEEVLH